MGIIQNAINQTLTTAGIAARLSPEYENKVELGKLKTKEKLLNLQQEALPKMTIDEYEQGLTQTAQEHKRIQAERASITQRRFELSPSRKTMREAAFNSGKPLMVFGADPDEIAYEQAMQEAAQKQEAQLKQQEAFKNYVTNLETSLGGKVGGLPEHVQALIMQQMNKEDK